MSRCLNPRMVLLMGEPNNEIGLGRGHGWHRWKFRWETCRLVTDSQKLSRWSEIVQLKACVCYYFSGDRVRLQSEATKATPQIFRRSNRSDDFVLVRIRLLSSGLGIFIPSSPSIKARVVDSIKLLCYTKG